MNEGLCRTLGGVIIWAYYRDLEEPRRVTAYWPASPVTRRSQVLDRTPVGRFSGHRDWTRGRSWDRRHRYGCR